MHVVSELTVMPEQAGTREKIMAAALETVREVGITGVSARAIAATGGFNQALIFYHFGSVTNLLTEAASASAAERVSSYRRLTEDVTSLSNLVEVARRLHDESERDGSIAVLTQLMAGAASDPEMGAAILEGFESWIALVEDTLSSTLAETPVGSVLPPREAAYAVAALFVGIELMTRLDPSKSEAGPVFDSLQDLAVLIESMPAVVARFIKSPKS